MTRIGVNPARGKTTSLRPARVTIAMLTYLPSLDGYFENRLEVLKLVIASLKAHTMLPADIFLFDNGSCPEVVDYLVALRNSGQIENLMLSQRNIGKIDALRILFSAAPGELIAYNDDDIFFYPGWLEACLEVLDNFPQAGMVSGVPVRNAALHANQCLEEYATQNRPYLTTRRARAIPDEWEKDWALSTGRNPEAHREETKDIFELVFKIEKPTGESIEAIAGANHFQFISPKQVILQALPNEWTGLLMGSMVELDEAVDRLGFLRLSTSRRYTRHIGNRLSDELRSEAASFGLDNAAVNKPAAPKSSMTNQRKHWLLRIPGGRKILHTLYRRLFDILYNR